MRTVQGCLLLASLLTLTACGNAASVGTTASMPEHQHVVEPGASLQAKADIINTKGEPIGTATFTQMPEGVKVRLEVSGLPPGVHGFHIHEKGKCDIPDFKTAGEHFNPEGKKHGFDNPQGPHAGDLPNINIGPDGKGVAEAIDKRVTLARGKANSILKADGTSIMIHAGPDDYKTDPAGNSGARIACGVIR